MNAQTNTSNTETTRRDEPAHIAAQFERTIARLRPEGQRQICALVIGLWLIEHRQYLAQVAQWAQAEDEAVTIKRC